MNEPSNQPTPDAGVINEQVKTAVSAQTRRAAATLQGQVAGQRLDSGRIVKRLQRPAPV